ncbi:DUF1304 family protein [Leptolyngbya sp. FACHB-671]|uniref:DUF1304 family protein n=1 Tax=Leptolyngbya sp. FACHB-671 TaxID=2692812 RepID=UPI001688B122|nr:DUF1304 family protein [Leptolyngbya sp. FACHB-671]MBD2065977.1 DUF1304 family protein [Leptolyngbya sp. FACHB-671]
MSIEANFKRNAMKYLKIVTTVTVVIVAAIHVVISIVEMFFWQNPLVYQRLDFPADVANQVVPIVQNAGLYNGFIACSGTYLGSFWQEQYCTTPGVFPGLRHYCWHLWGIDFEMDNACFANPSWMRSDGFCLVHTLPVQASGLIRFVT